MGDGHDREEAEAAGNECVQEEAGATCAGIREICSCN